jgi:hypothetical protein
MPTYDGGHYFLTVLAPIKKELIADGSGFNSAVNVLRERLAALPNIGQRPSPHPCQSPFARNTRNHFVRIGIIDDVAYNGRNEQNVAVMFLKNIDPTVAQPQDHLSCPFLFFLVDFDAENGADTERDSYLATLWDTMDSELKSIFGCCVGFDETVCDAASFAQYIGSCQIETTMSWNDYYVEDPHLPSWLGFADLRVLRLVNWIALFTVVVGFVALLLIGRLMLLLAGAAALGLVLWWVYRSIMAAGAKPYPTAPDSNLPAVLKALHLQRAFTQFAIDNQGLSAGASAADQLYAAFAKFLAANRPDNLESPTQPPGVYGI